MRLVPICCFFVLAVTSVSVAQIRSNIGSTSSAFGGADSAFNTGGQGANNQGPATPGGTSENLGSAFGQRESVLSGSGFVGQNMNAQPGGTGFVGQNQAVNNNPNGSQFRGGNQFGNTGGFRGNAGNFGGRQFQQLQQERTRRNIRTKLALPAHFLATYRYPTQRVQANLNDQFRRIDAAQGQARIDPGVDRVFRGANVSVTTTGRTVTLRGQVDSERERSLAARIAMLEPGVDRVENLLQVSP